MQTYSPASENQAQSPCAGAIRAIRSSVMATLRKPVVTLRGHLTTAALQGELARVDSLLGGTSSGLLVDASQMTGYDDAARALFVAWNTERRQQIPRVAIVTERTLWRVVIAAMSLASKQEMSVFADRGAAEAWAWADSDAGASITLHVHTGRLAELRIRRLALGDVPMLIQRISEHRQRFQKQGIVAIVDMRGFRTTSQLVFDRCLAMLQRNNPGVVRIAVLVPTDDALAAAQITRALRQAENPQRQAFREVAAVKSWLGQELSETERTRLAVFLHEAAPARAA